MRVPTALAKLTATLVIASSLVAPMSAQPAATPPDEPAAKITLEDAVRMAIGHNLTLVSERYSRYLARESLVLSRVPYEPVFSVTARDTFRQQPTQAQTTDTTRSDSQATDAGISQRVDTGANISLTTNLGRSKSAGGSTVTPDPVFDTGTSLRVTQPLLSGGGITVNRIARRRALIGVDRSDITFKARALDITRDTELAFYTLASARIQLDVQVSGLASAQKFLDENEARREAGLATELDVMQARVGVASRRSSIISGQQSVRNATDQLLALLGRTDFSGSVEPTGVNFGAAEPVSVERSFGAASQNDTDLQNALAAIKQLELDVRLAENQNLPRLDLGGTVGFSGRDRDSDPTLLGAGKSTFNGKGYNWQVDLSLNVPWGLHEGRSRLRSSKLTLEQQRARLNQLEQDLLVRVRAAVRAVQTDVQSIEISALSTELSTREYQLEKAKFDSGLSTSRLVVEAQQRMDEAQVRETQSRVQLRQNVARLRRIEGGSLDLYGIDVLKD